MKKRVVWATRFFCFALKPRLTMIQSSKPARPLFAATKDAPCGFCPLAFALKPWQALSYALRYKQRRFRRTAVPWPV